MDHIELPEEWDTSSETINIDHGLLRKCASRVSQQRTFDSQPLAIGLCYSCGRILWNPSHAHYSGLRGLASGVGSGGTIASPTSSPPSSTSTRAKSISTSVSGTTMGEGGGGLNSFR